MIRNDDFDGPRNLQSVIEKLSKKKLENILLVSHVSELIKIFLILNFYVIIVAITTESNQLMSFTFIWTTIQWRM